MRRVSLHPFLIAAYAVLALYAYNAAQVRLDDVLRPLLASLGLALVVWVVLTAFFKDVWRAAVATTLLLVLFFSYGHVYHFLEANPIWGFSFGRHRMLLPLWLSLAVLVLVWIASRLKDLDQATQALNLTLLAALAFPVLQIGSFMARSAAASAASPPFAAELAQVRLPQNQPAPDVYYIVLDAYTRTDVLQDIFDYDNSGFISALKEMGFYVADCSQSNYAQTELAFVSTLNFNYLDALDVSLDPGSDDRSGLYPLIKENAVRRGLEKLGYTIVAFDSDFYRTQVDNADIYLSAQTEAVGGVTGFEVMLVKTSLALAFSDTASLLPRYLVPDVEALKSEQHREAVLYELDKLREAPGLVDGPMFAFVHILSPHDPYVFGPQGEPVNFREPLSPEEEIEGYRGQVIFLNQRLLPALAAILRASEQPPLILLQGDHGAGWSSEQGRMAILNAYYLPGTPEEMLYPSISPVNSFRVVFDAYFGTNFGRLEDRSFFSVYATPYNFREVHAGAEACLPPGAGLPEAYSGRQ